MLAALTRWSRIRIVLWINQHMLTKDEKAVLFEMVEERIAVRMQEEEDAMLNLYPSSSHEGIRLRMNHPQDAAWNGEDH